MEDGLKRDFQRYLAQQAENGSTLWAAPAEGVTRMERTSSSESQSKPPETQPTPERQTQPAASTKPAPKPQPASPAPQPQTQPAAATASSQWERGAPDPDYSAAEDVFTLTDPFPDYTELDEFNQAIQGCQKCPLGATRQHFVFGVGDPNADLVLVGEAPGAEEDKQGMPFVGRAGKLLDQILAAVDLKRGDGVYICNILKCRPPNNRDPLPSEVHECEPHLLKQLQLLRPKLIVALGRIAAQTLLRTNESLTKLREQDLVYHGIPLIVTYHPAALLRNPNWKRPTWEDVQKMKRMLDEAREN